MPLKPMKKLLFYSLFSFFFSISFSQEIAIYIIELLNTDSSKEHHQIIKN